MMCSAVFNFQLKKCRGILTTVQLYPDFCTDRMKVEKGFLKSDTGVNEYVDGCDFA